MVALKENFWNFRGDDNLDRSHIPPTPYWIAIIRAAQVLFALLVLILTAVGASYFGATWSSLGVTWFTFALTLIHIGWLTLSILLFPIAYNYWAQLGVEIGSVVFWLASWAALAADASALGTVQYLNGFSRLNTDSRYNTAAGCIKGAAGVGALTWILFVITLVFFVISLVHYRKAKAPATGTTGPEAGAFEPKPGHELSQVPQQQPVQQQPAPYVQQPDQYMQQQQQQQQQVPPQQYQQPYQQPQYQPTVSPPPQGYTQQPGAPYPQ